jgi:hypothetical protein
MAINLHTAPRLQALSLVELPQAQHATASFSDLPPPHPTEMLFPIKNPKSFPPCVDTPNKRADGPPQTTPW